MLKAGLGVLPKIYRQMQPSSKVAADDDSFDCEASMLVKPRTPTPFRPLQTDLQMLINQERAKKASAKRIISISGVGNERYGKKHTKSPS